MTVIVFFFFLVPQEQEQKVMLSKDTESSGCPTWNERGRVRIQSPNTLRSPAARNTEGAFLGSPREGVGAVVRVCGSWCWWPSIWGHVGFCVPPGTAVRAVTQHPGALWAQPSLDDTALLFIVLLGLITKNKPCRVTPEVTGCWIRLSFLDINTFAQLLRVQVVVWNSPRNFVTVTLPNM